MPNDVRLFFSFRRLRISARCCLFCICCLSVPVADALNASAQIFLVCFCSFARRKMRWHDVVDVFNAFPQPEVKRSRVASVVGFVTTVIFIVALVALTTVLAVREFRSTPLLVQNVYPSGPNSQERIRGFQFDDFPGYLPLSQERYRDQPTISCTCDKPQFTLQSVRTYGWFNVINETRRTPCPGSERTFCLERLCADGCWLFCSVGPNLQRGSQARLQHRCRPWFWCLQRPPQYAAPFRATSYFAGTANQGR
jgi:hypothetical protein